MISLHLCICCKPPVDFSSCLPGFISEECFTFLSVGFVSQRTTDTFIGHVNIHEWEWAAPWLVTAMIKYLIRGLSQVIIICNQKFLYKNKKGEKWSVSKFYLHLIYIKCYLGDILYNSNFLKWTNDIYPSKIERNNFVDPKLLIKNINIFLTLMLFISIN